jgi:hypothetical protein
VSRTLGRRGSALLLAAALVVSGLTGLGTSPAAQAASAADFDAGNIISDEVFFASSAMSASQVQQFLQSKGATCVPGEQPCLKDYRTSTPDRPGETGLCRAYTGRPDQSAADVIVGVAQACGINPRVLVVLLEKENSLVTRTRPTTRSYQAATGFGCPDTAPCDSQYYGLFNQLYMAARQYQVYAQNPTRYGYRAGRTNTVRWHPDASCGTSQVFIVNQATAGLYNYTPYRPNAAALDNLYGTGDRCSSYGNRNFWRLFTDWFGSTQANTYLLRSDGDATVYLVSGSTKYPIANGDLLHALSPLGSVGFVSQQYLDRRTTGKVVQRALLGPDGTVYYVDAGIRLPFGSCAQVEDFGMTCGDAVALDAGPIAALAAGPRMTNLFRTTSGKAYYIQAGKRREVADDASLVAQGLPTSGVTLLESGVAYLPPGEPVARDGVVLAARDSADRLLRTQGAYVPLDAGMQRTAGLVNLPVRAMDTVSLRTVPRATPVVPLMRDDRGRTVLLTTAGRVVVSDAAAAGTSAPAAPAGLLDRVPDAGATSGPVFVKTEDDGTVYILRSGELRALRSWTDLVIVNGGDGDPRIHTIGRGTAPLMPAGPTQVAPGTLIIAPDDGTVYLADGMDGRVTVGSFAVTDELGVTRLMWLGSSDLARYRLRPGMLSTAVQCGPSRYLGLGGTLTPVPDAMVPVYGLTFTSLEASTCAALPRRSAPLDRFLRTPDGTIYFMQDGRKRAFRSYGAYVGAGGTPANTLQVSDFTASRFPTGDPY